ncbi:uncharacterized protein DS421_13g417030 [Arachis hypogaea]|nr:uncharacterized protein DS421_13g417030 [Arachis hypogaea]
MDHEGRAATITQRRRRGGGRRGETPAGSKARAETRGGRVAREARRRHKQEAQLEQTRRRETPEQLSSDGGERPDTSTRRGGSGKRRGNDGEHAVAVSRGELPTLPVCDCLWWCFRIS